MQPVKNKKLTYLLICAVAFVWGVVVYRVFFNEVKQEEQPSFQGSGTAGDPYDEYQAKNDTFKLVLNYRDPFLGTSGKEDPAPSEPAEKKLIPAGPSVNWEAIKYSGYITNPATKNIVSIIAVNGKERMISEGGLFEGVKLLKNRRDSILVSFLGKQKYIKQ